MSHSDSREVTNHLHDPSDMDSSKIEHLQGVLCTSTERLVDDLIDNFEQYELDEDANEALPYLGDGKQQRRSGYTKDRVYIEAVRTLAPDETKLDPTKTYKSTQLMVEVTGDGGFRAAVHVDELEGLMLADFKTPDTVRDGNVGKSGELDGLEDLLMAVELAAESAKA